MNYFKLPLVVLLSICVSGLLAIVPAARAGTDDSARARLSHRLFRRLHGRIQGRFRQQPRVTIRTKRIIKRADRSYNDVWGPIEDYRDGYQQGFEAGYTAGYERQQFNSSLPTGLAQARHQDSRVPIDVNVPTPASNDDSE